MLRKTISNKGDIYLKDSYKGYPKIFAKILKFKLNNKDYIDADQFKNFTFFSKTTFNFDTLEEEIAKLKINEKVLPNILKETLGFYDLKRWHYFYIGDDTTRGVLDLVNKGTYYYLDRDQIKDNILNFDIAKLIEYKKFLLGKENNISKNKLEFKPENKNQISILPFQKEGISFSICSEIAKENVMKNALDKINTKEFKKIFEKQNTLNSYYEHEVTVNKYEWEKNNYTNIQLHRITNKVNLLDDIKKCVEFARNRDLDKKLFICLSTDKKVEKDKILEIINS